MLNLDPAILDQDKIRLNRRKHWLKISLIPIISFVLIALFFARTGLYNLILAPSLEGGNYDASKAFTSFQKVGNLIEPYIPYYNSGFFSLMEAEKKEDLISAEEDFRESLKHNPPESMLCSVYGNLSYALELQGDIAKEEKAYDEALIFYNKAESTLYENNCASKEDNKEGSDKLSNEAKKRITKKREETVRLANGENGSDPTETKDGPTEISDDDLKAIQQLDVHSEEGGAQRFRQSFSNNNNYSSSNLPEL